MKAVLIVGYGSSMPYAAENLKRQAGLLAQRRRERIYTAFHRVNEPLIADAMRQMAEDGVDEAFVIPFFISDGVITREYLPREFGVGEDGVAKVGKKKIKIRFGRAVGSDPGVADVMLRRIKENGGVPGETPVLVIGHGSKDRDNSEVVGAAADRLRAAGYDVFVGFNEFCGPSIEESFDSALRTGSDRVIVVPMFIACGLHLKEEIPAKIGLKAGSTGGIVKRNGRSVEIRYAPAVGEDTYIVDVMSKEIDGAMKDRTEVRNGPA